MIPTINLENAMPNPIIKLAKINKFYIFLIVIDGVRA
jgi:hypothetical protein